MNKKQIKQALQADIDAKFNERRATVAAMEGQKSNPQVALMIEKNLGYMLALQDVTELLYSRKIF